MPSFLTDLQVIYLLFLGWIWGKRITHALKTFHNPPQVEPDHIESSASTPRDLVSVIIPAKNEEKNIGDCLNSLLAQDYPNYEIIVANDSSTDQTEAILKSFGSKVRYMNVSPTPQGWTGKNFAVHSAMNYAQGDWFLFTDADTRHETCSISASMAYVQSRKLAFLTLLPRCLTGGLIENILQPCMMGFIGLWFPLDQINSPDSKMHFANGQYILMRAELHHRIGGHEKVYDQYLEDFALMKRTKESGERAECAFGISVFGTRMYHAFHSIWRGWRRIFLHAYQKNIFSLLGKMLDVFITAVLPFFCLPFLIFSSLKNPATPGWLGIVSAVLMIFILMIVWRTYKMIRAKPIYFIFFPISTLILMLILGNAMFVASTGQKTKWR